MTIVADENIPFAREAFGTFGEIRLVAGRAIERTDLLDADALIVRSVTRVDHALLDETPIRFVGTATIGTDHIDRDYLERAGITFADAAGSNANSVAEYVTAALLELRARRILGIERQTLGIIGVGHVGSQVSAKAEALGMQVVEYDPPRARAEKEFRSASIQEVLGCDVVTLHVPLIAEGEERTYHLVDREFLAELPGGTTLINTARGAVVATDALASALRSGRLGAAVLDVWEGEPDVPGELLEMCTIATPHIAGYSFDGKVAGTAMMADALARFLARENAWHPASTLPEIARQVAIPSDAKGLDAVRVAVGAAYDVMGDDARLRALFSLAAEERRSGFDTLRKNYWQRREFPAYVISATDPGACRILEGLGFT